MQKVDDCIVMIAGDVGRISRQLKTRGCWIVVVIRTEDEFTMQRSVREVFMRMEVE